MIYYLILSYLFAPTDHYLVGHRIDGRVLYPATGYMVLAWRTLGKLTGQVWAEMPVCFQDVAIHRATIMPEEGEHDVLMRFPLGRFILERVCTLSRTQFFLCSLYLNKICFNQLQAR